MSNALISVRFTVDVPEEKLADIAATPDDGTDSWYEEAAVAAEEWVRDNPMDAIERYGQKHEPTVEYEA
jgi:hypothetical protein